MKTVSRALVALGLAAGCASPPPAPEMPRQRGLVAYPPRLAFLCVSPGCDTTLSLQIVASGDRRLAVKRIVLADDTGEFSFTPSQPAPFVLGAGSSFNIDVRYLPTKAPSARAVELRIDYTDASPVESEDRVPPGTLVVPLVRRLVGEPALLARPTLLSFGAVSAGNQKTLPVQLVNDGFGNVAVEIASIDAGHPAFQLAMPAQRTLVPDAGVELKVTFAPSGEVYARTDVVITPTSDEVFPAVVTVEGTSIALARAAIDPAGDVDFGELPRNGRRALEVDLVNQGGGSLEVASIAVNDPSGNVKVALSGGRQSATLAPLARERMEISVEGKVAGVVDATVSIASNDPQNPAFGFKVKGTVTEPQLLLSPASIDFGTVPVGWVVSRPVELKNTGYGPLTIKNISMVSGSSSLFRLKTLPSLPAVLERDQRMAVDVEFRAETQASFGGFLSVESDDFDSSFMEVPLKAVAGSCQAGCPIANGTPSCQKGVCEVGSCNIGWYDTDGQASTGCECKEVGTDPGGFCATGVYLGTLEDNGSQTSHTGIVPLTDDVDIIRFFAEDAFQFLSDDFDVRIRLDSADPNIQMCVYRHNTGAHENDCFFSNEACPSNRTYRRDSSGAGDDSADFIIKVYRNKNAPPTCTAYTVFMSNG